MNKFSFFSGNITHVRPLGVITLSDFADAHKSPTDKTKSLIDAIRLTTNKVEKRILKQSLHAFTPSVIIDKKRNYNNIIGFSGLMQIDIDKLKSKEEAEELKQYLFDTYKPIRVAYISPSGLGVKALIQIPKINVGVSVYDAIVEYKDYYRALADEFSQYDGFDGSPKNCVLPMFLSYDKNLLYRKDSEGIWDIKEDAPPPPPVLTHNLDIHPNQYSTKSQQYYEIKTRAIFERRIGDIVGEGHPQLIRACLILGSRVGFGYLSMFDALAITEHAIKSSEYLSKGINGYIKSAKWAINEGIKNPKAY